MAENEEGNPGYRAADWNRVVGRMQTQRGTVRVTVFQDDETPQIEEYPGEWSRGRLCQRLLRLEPGTRVRLIREEDQKGIVADLTTIAGEWQEIKKRR